MRPLRRIDGVFRTLHDALVGIQIDFSALRPTDFSKEDRDFAIAVWSDRVQTEYRSVQIMTRFLTEVLGAGDPLDVYAGAVDAIADEVRHTALCAAVVTALGGVPPLPDPVVETENPAFMALPMVERALGTAVSMLAVSETLSTGFIDDLRTRPNHPVIRAVLDATLADEETHHAFGWAYVEASLSRFDAAGRDFARQVVRVTLDPHEASARRVLAGMRADERRLDAWPEPELAWLGISSAERQALVYRRVHDQTLQPRLAALGLA
ncbi:MAG: ferritin-like domain-containing protein [bacterium]